MENGSGKLIEGEDYYLDEGLMVFTAQYHLRRGYCCESGCRHCPYEEKSGATSLLKKILGQDQGPHHCESCGDPFVCGATLRGCWCTEVKLSEATRHLLKKKFINCVCRKCLEQAERESMDSTSQP